MSHRDLFRSACVIALALVGSAWIATTAYSQAKAKDHEQSLNSTGSAERVITSDVAKWTVSISRTANPQELRQVSEGLQHDLDAVKAQIKSHGLDDATLTVQPATINVICDAGTGTYDARGQAVCGAGKMSGYALQQLITIESKNVEATQKATQDIPGALVNQGVIFTSVTLEYYYSKLSDVKMELLAEATKNAQARAKVIAEGAGATIGSLLDASAGVFQVTSINSTDISDYGTYDTTAVQKKVTSVVRASFRLMP